MRPRLPALAAGAALLLSLAACDEGLQITLDGFDYLDLYVHDAGPDRWGPDCHCVDARQPDLAPPDSARKPDTAPPDGPQTMDAPAPDLPQAPDSRQPDASQPDMSQDSAPQGDMTSNAPCGPGSPCKVLINEKLPTTSGHRNRQPAIALNSGEQPRVLFSLAVGGYTGYIGVRSSAGAWSVVATPFTLAMGGLEREPSGSFLALAHKGDIHTAIYTKVSSSSGYDVRYLKIGK